MSKWHVGNIIKQKSRKDMLAWQSLVRYTITNVTDKQISFVHNSDNDWIYTYDIEEFEKYLELG